VSKRRAPRSPQAQAKAAEAVQNQLEIAPPPGPEPQELPLLQVVAAARVFAVPLQTVMGGDMYNQWRRRTKRLLRAHQTASNTGDTQRALAIYRALRRLSTGSME